MFQFQNFNLFLFYTFYFYDDTFCLSLYFKTDHSYLLEYGYNSCFKVLSLWKFQHLYVLELVWADCLFLWHTLKLPDFFVYWVILDCILYTLNFVKWIWILFKFYREYSFCFCSYFNMHLTQLNSSCKSIPSFYKLFVQCQFIFQNLSVVLVYISYVCYMVASLESGKCFIP